MIGPSLDYESGWLVGEGLAIAYQHCSLMYAPLEDAAKVVRRGLRAGTFMEPWKWRRRQK